MHNDPTLNRHGTATEDLTLPTGLERTGHQSSMPDQGRQNR